MNELDIAADWVGPPANRSALLSLFCGDWSLGHYAANYFAKNLLPQQPEHLQRAATLGLDSSRVCLHCWHYNRNLVEEDEAHVLVDCPAHGNAREELAEALSLRVALALHTAKSSKDKLLTILGSQCASDWIAIGRFLSKVRQARRKAKLKFERLAKDLLARSYVQRKALWRSQGKAVCRHGVFWNKPVATHCPCMSNSVDALDWLDAALMPALEHETRTLVVTPFDCQYFSRMGILQAEMRRLGW